jgi:hypothetical protein
MTCRFFRPRKTGPAPGSRQARRPSFPIRARQTTHRSCCHVRLQDVAILARRPGSTDPLALVVRSRRTRPGEELRPSRSRHCCRHTKSVRSTGSRCSRAIPSGAVALRSVSLVHSASDEQVSLSSHQVTLAAAFSSLPSDRFPVSTEVKGGARRPADLKALFRVRVRCLLPACASRRPDAPLGLSAASTSGRGVRPPWSGDRVAGFPFLPRRRDPKVCAAAEAPSTSPPCPKACWLVVGGDAAWVSRRRHEPHPTCPGRRRCPKAVAGRFPTRGWLASRPHPRVVGGTWTGPVARWRPVRAWCRPEG